MGFRPDRDWPNGPAPCRVEGVTPLEPLDVAVAEETCADVADDQLRGDCVFDVRVTGDVGFAETYARTERMHHWGTTTTVSVASGHAGGSDVIRASVAPIWPSAAGTPTGKVRFYVGSDKVSEPVPIDEAGSAVWEPIGLVLPGQPVSARYLPGRDTEFLPSSSSEVVRPTR